MSSILIVEPDRITAQVIGRLFSRDGSSHEIVTALTGDEVRKAVGYRSIDLALIGHGPDAGSVIGYLDKLDPRPRIVVRDVGSDELEQLPDTVDAVIPGDRTADDLISNVEQQLAD